jgi:DNA-binding transcriptional MerR regulator
MAYYPPELIERIRLIKLLQEERFMPLRVIRELLESEDGDPERLRARLEAADAGLEVALARERERRPAGDVSEQFEVPLEALDRLAEIGVLSPAADGYSPSDVRIVAAISRFRAGGYDERIGFTVHDAARFLEPLEALVRREVELLSEKVIGRFDADRAAELIEAGTDPLADLIAAMNSKLLTAALEAPRRPDGG